ncbi:hypothetical protein [Marivirga arenosa]|uniref:Uncharacterized protein n=1 Tax=Marivirga arenosa TaxID=3059076 RepID=A0AA49JA01_9BACT|nr:MULTISPECIES: hypothetical protein [unclassified Marivirga]WKK83830.1 hypothetical protein QYS48_16375 [Marivirga sp. ABR2-2]WNB18809.1 hypothetical protein QYS47_31440 [Marivirga sp. BKB1-2]
MRRILGIFLITVSVNILLLHSFVPHHHSENGFNLNEILRNEPVKSPIDLLKIGFHLNLGANHLDNYQNNNSALAKHASQQSLSSNDLFLLVPTIIDFDFSQIENDNSIQLLIEDKIIQSIFKSSFSYRGPPSLI